MTKYLISAIIILSFGSCKSKTVYVPIESIKTEYIDRHKSDSIYVHDSVLIRAVADTFWIEKYKTIYRNRLRTDSIVRNDTIRVPYPVVETREVNRLSSWQILLMCLGAVLIGYASLKIFSLFK